MTRDRAFRRAQWDRAKQRAIRFLKAFVPSYAESPKRIAERATDRTPCSCPACGNPRKHFGDKTRAEIIADLTERQELE